MNQAIELHDSDLVSIKSIGDSVVLAFAPAYIHCSSGRPGIDSGTGWTQAATLAIRSASAFSPVTLPAEVSSGWLRVGHEVYQNVIPVGTFDGAIEFSAIAFAKDFLVRNDITIRCSHLTITLEGEPSHVEEFPHKSGAA